VPIHRWSEGKMFAGGGAPVSRGSTVPRIVVYLATSWPVSPPLNANAPLAGGAFTLLMGYRYGDSNPGFRTEKGL
jgi:hypothetical protein